MSRHIMHRTKYGIACCLLLVSGVAAFATTYLVNGHLQAQYAQINGDAHTAVPGGVTEQSDACAVKQISLAARAIVDERSSAYLRVQGQPSMHVQEAYGEYFAAPYRTRLGLIGMPFGLEARQCCETPYALEHAAVNTALLIPYAHNGGMSLERLAARGWGLGSALMQGDNEGNMAARDHAQFLVGRISYRTARSEVGFSGLTGRLVPRQGVDCCGEPVDAAASAVDATRVGLDLRVNAAPYTLIGELIAGRDAEIDAWGGYVTLAYRRPKSTHQVYLRGDYFNPDTDKGADEYQRVTAGYSIFWNSKTKITVEYAAINDRRQPAGRGKFIAQYDVRF